MTRLELSAVGRIFDDGRTTALNSVDLAVAPGELLAVVGRSGSGKSTLLNILGLLDTADSGLYMLDGKDVSDLDDGARARLRSSLFGFVFQDGHLIPYLSAGENVRLALTIAGHGFHGTERVVMAELERLGVGDKGASMPSTLSGGERQRVALARALVKRPPVLLCDEPSGNLDAESRDVVFAALVEAALSGTTVILVTHDSELADRCDRTVRLADGRSAA